MRLDWSLQIAGGMEFITSKKIIHSDLACRNVLVAADLSIRITDFGLSRKLENYADYVKTGKEALPWRWMAVESLDKRSFSQASDVWSFGVTVWEIYSSGSVPYPGESYTMEFVQVLKSGQRLFQPQHASDQLYLKMKECWQLEPSLRPTFKDLACYFYELQSSERGNTNEQLYNIC